MAPTDFAPICSRSSQDALLHTWLKLLWQYPLKTTAGPRLSKIVSGGAIGARDVADVSALFCQPMFFTGRSSFRLMSFPLPSYPAESWYWLVVAMDLFLCLSVSFKSFGHTTLLQLSWFFFESLAKPATSTSMTSSRASTTMHCLSTSTIG